MDIDIAKIEAAVVREVADNLIGSDALWERVKSDIKTRMDNLWADVVEARLKDEIQKAITEGFERSYCRVDVYGRPQGSPTTISAELQRLVAGYWNERVDRNGKPDSSTYGTTYTRAEWVMMQMVTEKFSADMKQHVVNLGGALKDGLRAELQTTVNRLLSEVFHVKSLGDMSVKENGRAFMDPPVKPAA